MKLRRCYLKSKHYKRLVAQVQLQKEKIQSLSNSIVVMSVTLMEALERIKQLEVQNEIR